MLQQTLQFSLPPYPSSSQEREDILPSLPRHLRAPIPTDHEDVRGVVAAALTSSVPLDLPLLLTANVATLLPLRLPDGLEAPRMVWRVLDRLCAGGLSRLEVRGVFDGGATLDWAAWQGEEEFYQTRLDRDDLVDALLRFANEILESRDTAGRLYTLLHPSVSGGEGRFLVGYFTEGEAVVLEAAGLGLAWV